MPEFLISILDFFIPRFCLHCNKKLLPNIKYICPDCFNLIENTSSDFISKEFEKKFTADGIISDFTSSFIFNSNSPIHNLIHSLKYSNNYKIGSFLGNRAAENCLDTLRTYGIDFIIPIPLHGAKQAERGYNQSDYIAKGIGEIINKPVTNKIISRSKFTISQTGFNFEDRKNNMKQAFTIKKGNNVVGKNFLIVDDVITTGATISACAKVLKEKKAKNIFAFSIAIPTDTTFYQEQKPQELQDHF